jgi:hypothetical protein
MGIKGLTDREMKFPQIGIIRKGSPKVEKTNAKGEKYESVGRDLTYFRVEFDEAEKDAAALFAKTYGLQPSEINILLPFDEVSRMWDPFMEAYNAGSMYAQSDGEWMVFEANPATGEIVIKNGVDVKTGLRVKHHDILNKKGDNTLKPVGRLLVIVPELARLAYLVVKTTSILDVANISGQLEALKNINGGKLAGIPMKLRRRPKMVSAPMENGKRARVEKYLVSIEADPMWVKRQLVEMKRLALPGNGLEMNLLPPTVAPEAPIEGKWTDDEEDETQEETKPTWQPDVIAFIVEWSKHKPEDIIDLLGFSNLIGDEPREVISNWVATYKAVREKDKVTKEAAIKQADDWLADFKAKNAQQDKMPL